jgi:phosphatidylglycerol:prolipoprotein diacylglycerol transferase
MALAATLVAVSAIWIGIVRYKQMKMGKMVDTPPQSTTKE